MDIVKIVIFVALVALVIGGLVEIVPAFITSFTGAIESIYDVPGIFPSIWNCFPTSITSVFLALFIAGLGIAVIKVALR